MSTESADARRAELVGHDQLEVQRAPDRCAGAANVGFCAVALESVTWSGPVVSGSPTPSTCVHAYVIV